MAPLRLLSPTPVHAGVILHPYGREEVILPAPHTRGSDPSFAAKAQYTVSSLINNLLSGIVVEKLGIFFPRKRGIIKVASFCKEIRRILFKGRGIGINYAIEQTDLFI